MTGKCDRTKAPNAQGDAENAFACFDDAFNAPKTDPCLQATLLGSKYAVVLNAQEKTATQHAIQNVLDPAYTANKCSDATTLCLDRDGNTIGPKKHLQKGDQLKVVVLSPYGNDVDDGNVFVTITDVSQTDSMTDTPPATHTEQYRQALTNPVVVYVLAAAVSEAIGDGVVALNIAYRRNGGKTKHHRLPVARGRYYVDFGVTLPVVIEGNRTVTGTAIDKSTAPRLALSALVFLAGRPKDAVRLHGWSTVGIQIATDFDFTKGVQDKDYYLGVAWEPIAGFGLDAGVAFVKGQYLPAVAGPPQENYMLCPYVGVFLTPDFVTSAKAVATELTGP